MSVFQLSETLDRLGAQKAAESLLQLRGEDLVIDGAAVARLSTQAVEVLLAAQNQWMSDGFQLRFASMSEAACETIERLGLSDHIGRDR